MTISWGAWEDSGGNGMRVGVEATSTGVNTSSTTTTYTFKIYTQNRYAYNDPQVLTYGGSAGSGSTSFTNASGSSSSGGGAVLRATRTYTYTYPSTSYGSSPATINFTVALSGAYNGVTPSWSGSYNIAPRPYAAPTAPSGVSAARNSDSQATVSWTRNVTAQKPYTSLTVQMRTYTGGYWFPWQTVATVSGTATSYVKTGLSSNHAYQFKVRSNNSAGSSAFITTSNIYTTPAAPSGADSAINTAGTQITTTWTNNHYSYTGITLRVERSVNGGAWTEVVSGLAYNTTSWTDGSPGAGNNQYRVRAYLSTGALYSGYTTGDVISTATAPLAPTNLAPNGGKVDLANQNVTLTWKHNPGTDKAKQSSYHIRYSSDGGTTWADLRYADSTVSSYTIPAGTLPNGTTFQWQVRTRGVTSSGYGPFSSSATMLGASTPTVTIYPAGTTANARFNYVPNPSAEVNTTGWNVSGTGAALARDTTQAWTGTASFKLTAGTTNSGMNVVLTGLNPGATYTASAYIYVPSATTVAFKINPQGSADGTQVTTKDAWVRSTATFVPDSDTWTIYFDSPTGNFTSGSVWIDGIMVEDGDTAGPYFDGSFADTANMDYGWVGAAHASVSTANALSGSDGTDIVKQLPLVMSWAYNQDEGALQTAWEARLFADDGVTLLESQTGTGFGTTVTWKYPVEDSKNYITEIRAQASNGLWSNRISRFAVIRLPKPAASHIDAEYQPCTGTMVLHLTADIPAENKVRTNLCTNPSFEVDTTGWGNNAFGYTACTIARDTTKATQGTSSMKVTWPTGKSCIFYGFPTTAGVTYTFSIDVYVPAGSPSVGVGDVFGAANYSTTKDQWERVSASLVGDGNTRYFGVQTPSPSDGQLCWVDAALIEESSEVGGYFDGSSANYLGTVYAWTGNSNSSTSTETFTAEGSVDHVIVERRTNDGDWVVLADNVPVPNDLVDIIPVTNGPNVYRVTSVSAAPSYLANDPVTVYGTDGQVGAAGRDGLWVFLAYGPSFTNVLRFRTEPELSETIGREREARQFLGRKKPMLLTGENTSRVVSVAGALHYDGRCAHPQVGDCHFDSPPSDWVDMALEAGLVCYRDFTGRRLFGMLSDVDIKDGQWPGNGSVSFSVTEVDHTELDGTVELVDVVTSG